MKKLFFVLALLLASCGRDEQPWTPPGGEFNGAQVVAEPDEWDGVRRGALTYQLLVYSFADGPDADRTGDLAGLTARLDYIDLLGAGAVWLSPIHPSPSYHGYDVTDYDAVNPTFGDRAALQTFIDAAHARGIKVYLDWVLNHTSAAHPWFASARSDAASEWRDFYAFAADPPADIAAGNVAQIATEGAAGYDAGQWFSTNSGAGMTGRLRFELDWNALTVTVSRTDAAADPENTASGAADRYLYFGEDTARRFYNRGGGLYDLTLDFASEWGFLIRTTTASWNAGEKFGAPDAQTTIELDQPFKLDSAAAANIAFVLSEQFHSHFGTDTFADLNYGAASTAETSPAFRALAASADGWLAMGVDGLRLDAVKHIYHNAYSDENPVFLRAFHRRLGEKVYMVGEMYDSYDRAAPYYAGLPALFEFDFWNRLKWALQNGVGRYFAGDVLKMRAAYAAVRTDYIAATKLTNHDENRAGSELGGSTERMRLAAAVLLTASGEPYVYQGEELGYRGTRDGGDEWVRTPVMWDAAGADLAAGALSGKIDREMLTAAISVERQAAERGSVLDVYRTFARLRNTYSALAAGEMTACETGSEAVAAWYRTAGTQRMLVLHNFSAAEQTLALADQPTKAVGVLGSVSLDAAAGRVRMGAYSSVVFIL